MQQRNGGRVERDIIAVLLVLMAFAVSWWAGTWWRAAQAEAATAPRPPHLGAAVAPTPARVDRRRARPLMVARRPTSAADAGVERARATHALPKPGRATHGVEQGHGSERWRRSDSPERPDFEPRHSPDAGTFTEAPPVAAEASRAFH
jgi:uncharacterized membrane protein